MPQMMPLMWKMLALYFIALLLLLITPVIYFLYKPHMKQTKLNLKKPLWNWQW